MSQVEINLAKICGNTRSPYYGTIEALYDFHEELVHLLKKPPLARSV